MVVRIVIACAVMIAATAMASRAPAALVPGAGPGPVVTAEPAPGRQPPAALAQPL